MRQVHPRPRARARCPQWLAASLAAALLTTMVAVAASTAPVGAAATCPTDDALEPNDTSEAAVVVDAFVSFELASCGDDDWFVLEDARPGVEVRVNLDFAHADGDLDVQLFDPIASVGPVAQGISSTDDESARYTVPLAGLDGRPIYVRVFGAVVNSGGGPEISQNSYAMSVSVERCPPDDLREDDDTFATATPLGDDTVRYGMACDPDVVEVPLERGERLSAVLTVPDTEVALALHLFDSPSMSSVIVSRTANQKVQEIDIVALESATYYLVVDERFTGSSGGVPYELRIDVAGPCASGFGDVGSAYPFCPEIAFVANDGLIDGFPDGTYDPTLVVSRQALAKMLYGYFGADFTPPDDATFTDVPVGTPFRTEIEWLVAQGFVSGFGDGTFRPTAPVSRQAFAAMIDFRCEGAPAPEPPSFTDVGPTHPFVDPIGCMVATEVTTGFADGTFRPTLPVTRQTAAAYLARMSLNS